MSRLVCSELGDDARVVKSRTTAVVLAAVTKELFTPGLANDRVVQARRTIHLLGCNILKSLSMAAYNGRLQSFMCHELGSLVVG